LLLVPFLKDKRGFVVIEEEEEEAFDSFCLENLFTQE
jgi:hypothetical protein